MELLDAIHTRRSIRKYLDKPVRLASASGTGVRSIAES